MKRSSRQLWAFVLLMPLSNLMGGCAQTSSDVSETRVPLKKIGTTLLVQATINGMVQVPFVLDSGASDVTIPADVVAVLEQAGTITGDDLLLPQTYGLADGSTASSRTFRLRSVKVGNRVLQNVTGSVALNSRGFLLGQSFLDRFRSWSVDNEQNILVLD